ncbi:MAG: Uncharacterized protein XD58_1194 [Thermotoga sp. 50_1627]|uniref:hypothetical protein n=1 Tax=Pseudothermotoga sp. TaxID=2033661 RepID=UPI00076DB73F|nr:MAG: Uncharacterized protein XD45_0170 [Thermotoga sp. 50_64]KUK24800.1 MAG: Uncharacterized protein XD58_1194 [Thermotoga sp. 50_1627]MBC7117190.1 hypothetical protein [Pseudothermotoga sp.]HBT40193.1 hypothetical protein [Pseudothermotoga sp.]HCO98674.1 hypothetical protein [Pseudothermotoga sp.]
MDVEKYVRAIEKSLTQMVLREMSSVDVSEIWIDTSIPVDLIVEILKTHQLKIPEELHSITNAGKIIWVRKV